MKYMNIRQMVEEREKQTLSEFAALSMNSKGRERKEPPTEDIRTCYSVDRDRILYSHAFRREQHKTQVFIMPSNDHIMNRLTHTLEVAQIAKTIAIALRLNETLTEAIALGHDTAHTCFGHAGEHALDRLAKKHGKKEGYVHSDQAYRRLNVISNLNLTYEVLDGIKNHSGIEKIPRAATLEGQIVQYADKIAYLPSDMENAITNGILSGMDAYPKEITKVLGKSKSEIIDKLIRAIIIASKGREYITMADNIYDVFTKYRDFNFKNIYYSNVLRESNKRAEMIIECLFEYYLDHPEEVEKQTDSGDIIQDIIDYISGMTDNFAFAEFQKKI